MGNNHVYRADPVHAGFRVTPSPMQVSVEKQLRDAWNLYLVECKTRPECDYEQVEPGAWRRLRRRLREVREFVEYEAS